MKKIGKSEKCKINGRKKEKRNAVMMAGRMIITDKKMSRLRVTMNGNRKRSGMMSARGRRKAKKCKVPNALNSPTW